MPNYDDHLARRAIYLLKWAPACSLILGYWALSNTQYFFNAPETIDHTSNEVPSVNHPFIPMIGANPGWLCLLFLTDIFVHLIFSESIFNMIYRNFFSTDGNQRFDHMEAFDERLGTVYDCLAADQKIKLLAHELYFRNQLKIRTMDDYALNCLWSSTHKRTNMRTFLSEVSYDILANIQYRIKFQYCQLAERIDLKKKVEKEKLQDAFSDVIVKLLNQNEMSLTEKDERDANVKVIEDLMQGSSISLSLLRKVKQDVRSKTVKLKFESAFS